MKKLIAVAFLIIPALSFAETSVSGYVRRDGTYVQPHYRSNANGIRIDNYSSQGNSNPYTGQRGYADAIRQQTLQMQYQQHIETQRYNQEQAQRIRDNGAQLNPNIILQGRQVDLGETYYRAYDQGARASPPAEAHDEETDITLAFKNDTPEKAQKRVRLIRKYTDDMKGYASVLLDKDKKAKMTKAEIEDLMIRFNLCGMMIETLTKGVDMDELEDVGKLEY